MERGAHCKGAEGTRQKSFLGACAVKKKFFDPCNDDSDERNIMPISRGVRDKLQIKGIMTVITGIAQMNLIEACPENFRRGSVVAEKAEPPSSMTDMHGAEMISTSYASPEKRALHGRNRKASAIGISEGCHGISHPEQETQGGLQRFFIEETLKRFFRVNPPPGRGWGRLRTTRVRALHGCRSRVARGRNGTKRITIFRILLLNKTT